MRAPTTIPPPPRPDTGVPAFVLVTPAARARLAEFKSNYAGYLVKPVRQTSLFARFHAGGPAKQAGPGARFSVRAAAAARTRGARRPQGAAR